MPVVPVVTIVMPCHNHVRWVKEAFASVAAQTYTAKRLVVVDDGSTDGSHEAALSLLQNCYEVTAATGPQVWVGGVPGMNVMIHRFEQAGGPSFARNHGVRCGWEGTDAFAFLDSDDAYHPEKLARSVAKWSEAPEHVGGVYSDYSTANEQTGVVVREYKEPFSRLRLMRECLPNMDSLVSKLALEKCGLFDEEMRVCEDYDLWFRISEKFLLVHLPEDLVTIRTGGHSSTSTVRRDVWEKNWRRIGEKAQERARNAR